MTGTVELTVTPYVHRGMAMPTVTEALDLAAREAERIGHGAGCLADPRLVAHPREIDAMA